MFLITKLKINMHIILRRKKNLIFFSKIIQVQFDTVEKFAVLHSNI